MKNAIIILASLVAITFASCEPKDIKPNDNPKPTDTTKVEDTTKVDVDTLVYLKNRDMLNGTNIEYTYTDFETKQLRKSTIDSLVSDYLLQIKNTINSDLFTFNTARINCLEYTDVNTYKIKIDVLSVFNQTLAKTSTLNIESTNGVIKTYVPNISVASGSGFSTSQNRITNNIEHTAIPIIYNNNKLYEVALRSDNDQTYYVDVNFYNFSNLDGFEEYNTISRVQLVFSDNIRYTFEYVPNTTSFRYFTQVPYNMDYNLRGTQLTEIVINNISYKMSGDQKTILQRLINTNI